MIEEEGNIAPAAWIIKTPRPSNPSFCQSIRDAKFAHAGTNLDITDAISCHFYLHFLMNAASRNPKQAEHLASQEKLAENEEFS